MRLLPHSNGVRKVNMKKKRTTKQKVKIIAAIMVAIVIIGFTFQRISNFIAKETLRPRVDYTTVDDKRMDYRLQGEGKYTIVFDGELGGNLEAWSSVVEKLEEDDVTTFVYNRRGYGYSDNGPARTIEQQAQDLKILLRKSGALEPYILVGEGYGSLVLTSFAEQFPDSVAGAVLVDPIIEKELGTKEYKNKNLITKIRRKIEEIGSNVGLTTLLQKTNLEVKVTDFENNISKEALDEFEVHRTKSSYTSAVYNELNNLILGNSHSQEAGLFKSKPYYLITKEEGNTLTNLGDDALTKINISKTDKEFLSLNASDNIITGIRHVIKELNDLERKNRINSN